MKDLNLHEHIQSKHLGLGGRVVTQFENHLYAIALHYMHYNFCRIHQTLRVTPAMEAGVTDHVWNIEEVVSLPDLEGARKAA